MASVNKSIILGNSTKDPEVRYTPSGVAICTIGIATNRVWKGKDGAKQEEVEFHRVVFYDKLAEIAGEYLKKGKPVYIEGRLKTRKWEKDGHTNYTTEVIAYEMQLLGSREEAPAPTPSPISRPPAKSPTAFDDIDSDGIPF